MTPGIECSPSTLGAKQEVPEPHHRTGPPPREAPTRRMLGLKSQNGSVGPPRHRVGGKDQERAVQDRHAWRTHGNNAGNLAGRPGCVSRLLPIDEANTTGCRPSPKFAPEPRGTPAVERSNRVRLSGSSQRADVVAHSTSVILTASTSTVGFIVTRAPAVSSCSRYQMGQSDCQSHTQKDFQAAGRALNRITGRRSAAETGRNFTPRSSALAARSPK